jgi:Bax protein
LRAGEKLDAVDRLWLMVAADRYRVDAEDLAALARRMDVIPPSLALAQAAVESGWGTSRFAREGNALFGQWTF